METRIVNDEKDPYTFHVWIGNRRIRTTWAESSVSESVTKEWLTQITRIYKQGKKNKSIIVGLVAESSKHYRNGNSYYRSSWSKATHSWCETKEPIDVIQLCIGNHCLIYELDWHDRYDEMPAKCLREFLHDTRTVVVGVGMEKVAKQLEEDYGLLIARAVELRGLVKGAKKDVRLEKLGKMVLGEEWSVVRPSGISWWRGGMNDDNQFLSDDKVLYGTFDALLAYEMGVKLMVDNPQ